MEAPLPSAPDEPVLFDDQGGGAPVLLVHGQPGQRSDWDLVASRLRPAHRVVVPDRPGYGASPGPASGPRANASALAGLIDGLDLAPVTVAGHSYGAAVALRLAQLHPSLVRALVLVCPAAGPAALGTADRLLALPGLGEAVAFAVMRSSANFAYWAGRLVSPERLSVLPARLGLPADRMGAFTETWRTGNLWRVFAAEQRALVAEMPALVAGSGDVTMPVTILAGRRDRVIRPPVVDELAGALPNSHVVWSESGGHLLPWQQPDLVAQVVADAAGAA